MSNPIALNPIQRVNFRLDYSWFIMIVLGTWSLASYDIPATDPGWSPSAYWIFGIITSALFFASILVHELAHIVVARIYRAPVSGMTLFLFGGAARIGQEPQKPHEEVLIALAGPCASLVLAALLHEVSRRTVGSAEPLHMITGWLAWLNLMLTLFNLIPAFPLDGGRIFRAVLWDGLADMRRATTIAIGVSWLIVLSLIFYGIWLGFWQIRGGLWGEGLWIAGMGWLLNRATRQAEQQLALHDQTLLAGHTVSETMRADYPHIFGRLTLDIVMEQVVQPNRRHYYLVGQREQLDGLLSYDHIKAVPCKRWPTTHVADIMIPLNELKTVRPDDALTTIFERMATEDVHQFLVLEGKRCVGMVSHDMLLSFLHIQMELAT